MDQILFAAQHQGHREYQEDSWHFTNPEEEADGLLMIICDGMGGHVGGKHASLSVLNNFTGHFRKHSDMALDQRLAKSLAHAHQTLLAQIESDASLSGMGTTLLAVYIRHNDLNWISVGDSPLFLIRDDHIQRLNDDHSMVPVLEKMCEDGVISQEDFDTDPRRNMLRSAVSDDDLKHIDQKLCGDFLRADDILLLASDGLETLSLDVLCHQVTKNSRAGAKKLTRQLIQATLAAEKPNQDNVTVISYIHNPAPHLTGSWTDRLCNLFAHLVSKSEAARITDHENRRPRSGESLLRRFIHLIQ